MNFKLEIFFGPKTRQPISLLKVFLVALANMKFLGSSLICSMEKGMYQCTLLRLCHKPLYFTKCHTRLVQSIALLTCWGKLLHCESCMSNIDNIKYGGAQGHELVWRKEMYCDPILPDHHITQTFSPETIVVVVLTCHHGFLTVIQIC